MDGLIDSRQLRAFIALAHGGGLKAASKSLTLTESAVSHAVRNLEKDMGVRLFRRVGKGLQLTESGEFLLRETVPIMARMQDVRFRLTADQAATSSKIKIVASTSFIRIALHDVLEELYFSFPDVQVSVTAADRYGCLEALKKGDANVAILVNFPDGVSEIRGEHLFSDRMQVFMSAKHRLAKYSKIPVHMLCNENVYMRSRKNFTCSMIENEIGRHSFKLRKVMSMGSSEALREMVRLGIGITFESPWVLNKVENLDDFVWREIQDVNLVRNWYFAWPETTTMDLKMRILLKLCKKVSMSIVQGSKECELDRELGR